MSDLVPGIDKVSNSLPLLALCFQYFQRTMAVSSRLYTFSPILPSGSGRQRYNLFDHQRSGKDPISSSCRYSSYQEGYMIRKGRAKIQRLYIPANILWSFFHPVINRKRDRCRRMQKHPLIIASAPLRSCPRHFQRFSVEVRAPPPA